VSRIVEAGRGAEVKTPRPGAGGVSHLDGSCLILFLGCDVEVILCFWRANLVVRWLDVQQRVKVC
jgi:hypothetical protein